MNNDCGKQNPSSFSSTLEKDGEKSNGGKNQPKLLFHNNFDQNRFSLLNTDTLNDEKLSLSEKLVKIFVLRLNQIAVQYRSFYIFVYEITLYEILILIIRQCLNDPCDPAKCTHSKQTGLIGKKHTSLLKVLESVRLLDISGQITQFIGLPHLWAPFNSFTKIVNSDLFIFSHFINANYINLLGCVPMEHDDCDGVVWILNDTDFDEFTMELAIQTVDYEILKILNRWPKTSPKETNSDKQIELMKQEQEQLGRLYLMDYLHRWYLKRCEQSSQMATAEVSESSKSDTTSVNKSDQRQMTIRQKQNLLKQKEAEIQRLLALLDNSDWSHKNVSNKTKIQSNTSKQVKSSSKKSTTIKSQNK